MDKSTTIVGNLNILFSGIDRKGRLNQQQCERLKPSHQLFWHNWHNHKTPPNTLSSQDRPQNKSQYIVVDWNTTKSSLWPQ